MDRNNIWPNHLYTTEAVLKLCCITPPRLKELIRRGFIKPTKPSKGKRDRNGFNINDIIKIKITTLLSEIGINRKYAKYVPTNLQKVAVSLPLGLILIIDIEKIRDEIDFSKLN